MKVVDKKLIFIDSVERDSGTSDDFTISLPSHLLTREPHQTMRLVLNDLVLPYTWYNVQSSNSNFMVQELHNSPAYITILLDEGSYHVLQLRDHVKAKLAASALLETYDVSYDEKSGKFTIAAANTSGIYTLHLPAGSVYKLLGFPANIAQAAYNFTLGKITSEKSVNMMYTDALYLYCDLPTTNINKGTGDHTSFHLSSAFAKIPVNTAPFSNIIYTNINDDYTTNVPDKFIQTMRFHFRTGDHKVITLNDDFSFTLKLEILEDDEKQLVNQNTAIGELLRTLLLQQHVVQKSTPKK